jgi:hypothetical protein
VSEETSYRALQGEQEFSRRTKQGPKTGQPQNMGCCGSLTMAFCNYMHDTSSLFNRNHLSTKNKIKTTIVS